MAQSSPSAMPPDTRIAGDKKVSDWLALRTQLIEEPTGWKRAFDFFKLRIETRFLQPIQSILSIDRQLGEGHAACALQCVPVEFLEAFHQGKLYRPPLEERTLGERAKRLGITPEQLERHTQPNEYASSASLFVSFLTNRKPFARAFTKRRASTFYRHFRCGLLHEAATKGGSKVRSQKPEDPDCLVEETGNGLVIYRDACQRALLDYLKAYSKELLQSKPLQAHFIRKMDDIAQVERCFYFAYGSNLDIGQIRSRLGYVHTKTKAKLSGYAFHYNIKEEIGWLKLVFGILVAIDVSLVAWLAQNYTIADRVLVLAGLVAVGGVTIAVVWVNRVAIRRFKQLEEL